MALFGPTPAGDKLWVTTAADPEVWAVDFVGNEVRRVRWRLPDRPRSAVELCDVVLSITEADTAQATVRLTP